LWLPFFLRWATERGKLPFCSATIAAMVPAAKLRQSPAVFALRDTTASVTTAAG